MAALGLPWLVLSVVSAFIVLIARLAPAGKSFRVRPKPRARALPLPRRPP